MDERFVPLATYVRTAPAAAVPLVAAPLASAPGTLAESLPAGILAFAHADLVHDLALMRIAALEAFEQTARRAIVALAHEVLARELALAPVDIEALVTHALEEFVAHEPVSLTVSVADRERVRAPLPIRADPTLAPGDLIIEVRDGAFESRFAFRLAEALDRQQAREGART